MHTIHSFTQHHHKKRLKKKYQYFDAAFARKHYRMEPFDMTVWFHPGKKRRRIVGAVTSPIIDIDKRRLIRFRRINNNAFVCAQMLQNVISSQLEELLALVSKDT